MKAKPFRRWRGIFLFLPVILTQLPAHAKLDTVRFTWVVESNTEMNRGFHFSGTYGQFVIDWGDGSTSETAGAWQSHEYEHSGNFNVMLRSLPSDDEGGDPRVTELTFAQGLTLTSLNVSGCTALENLNCTSNQLTNLNVSECTALTVLRCFQNRLTSLNVSSCTALTDLQCSENLLTSLNVSGCTALRNLNCFYNQLSSLNVSGCTALENLDCTSNQLTNLNVSECTALTDLQCSENLLTSLNVSGCTALEDLTCSNNQLTNLNVSGCTALENLDCCSNQLSILDVSQNTSLSELCCYNNHLCSLDVSRNPALKEVHCWGNLYLVPLNSERSFDLSSLPGLDVTKMQTVGGGHIEGNILYFDADAVSYVYEIGNGLTRVFNLLARNREVRDTIRFTWTVDNWRVDEEQWVDIEMVGTRGGRFVVDWGDGSTPDTLTGRGLDHFDNGDGINNLTHEYTENKDYRVLMYGLEETDYILGLAFFDYSKLTSLDVSRSPALMALLCFGSQLTSLDVSKNPALTDLDCSHSLLTSLDISNNLALGDLDCSHNQLTGLDVSKNPVLWQLVCSYNRIPLSVLYDAYSQHSYFDGYEECFYASRQSDSIVLQVGTDFDLSSEGRIGGQASTYRITDEEGREITASGQWEEKDFVFRFNKTRTYRLEIRNSALPVDTWNEDDAPDEDSVEVSFTWYITVREGLPADHFSVQVASNNSEWGSATITGNGTYTEGTDVTITATPKQGYRFVNWTKKDGSVFSTEAVHTFTVTENLELTANFASDGVENESRGQDNFYVYVKDRIIYLSRETGTVSVYDAAGGCIYSGHATTIPMQHSGLYVVRANGRVYKVMVK